MILVEAVLNFSIPDSAPPDLVEIATFSNQDITLSDTESINLGYPIRKKTCPFFCARSINFTVRIVLSDTVHVRVFFTGKVLVE
jgi:hypothetical protein